MYKLVNTKKAYELYRHNSKRYTLVCKAQTDNGMLEFAETIAPNIRQEELLEAMRFMVKENHNVAEFGIGGTFVVSYKE